MLQIEEPVPPYQHGLRRQYQCRVHIGQICVPEFPRQQCRTISLYARSGPDLGCNSALMLEPSLSPEMQRPTLSSQLFEKEPVGPNLVTLAMRTATDAAMDSCYS